MAERRRKNESLPGGPNQPRAPIFGAGVSNIIPGEILVQLEEEVAARIISNIHTGPSRGAIVGASTFGVSEIDSVLASLNVTSITRLHPPISPTTAAVEAAAAVASTFRLRFDGPVSAENAVEQLNSLNEVSFAEPNVYRETYVIPNDPSFPSQWGLTKINCPAAWDRTTGSPNIVVAVIDTGVDLDHPELAPLLVQGTDMVDLGTNPVPPPGFRFEGDFTGRDNDPQDEVGHGTHVAGTIACLSNNANGVAGVTWNCRIMPVRVLARIVNVNNNADVRGTGSAADIAAGIRWAVDHGARVLNLSLGGPVDTQVERDAIAYAISRGAVVVVAMGNNGNNIPSYPAAYPDVVAVGAINQTDQRANFSNMGPHIDVVGPGVGVLSTVWDNGFATMSGTSMATPHVAGVAALVLSCNAGLTGAQVADILRQTARPLRDNPADPVPNDQYGYGLVDAQAAVNRACPQASVPIIQCPSNIACPPPSRPVISCPSVVTRCPSVQIICAPSRPVITCRSVITPCVTVSIHCNQISRVIRCPTEVCPSGPVCGVNPPDPRGPFAAQGMDPYASSWYNPYEWGGESWTAFDPYSMWYGADPEGDEGSNK